jgi:hypothetical protein
LVSADYRAIKKQPPRSCIRSLDTAKDERAQENRGAPQDAAHNESRQDGPDRLTTTPIVTAGLRVAASRACSPRDFASG